LFAQAIQTKCIDPTKKTVMPPGMISGFATKMLNETKIQLDFGDDAECVEEGGEDAIVAEKRKKKSGAECDQDEKIPRKRARKSAPVVVATDPAHPISTVVESPAVAVVVGIPV
jgi:hypothetical protein